jgi:hypothetical protein
MVPLKEYKPWFSNVLHTIAALMLTESSLLLEEVIGEEASILPVLYSSFLVDLFPQIVNDSNLLFIRHPNCMITSDRHDKWQFILIQYTDECFTFSVKTIC